MQKDKLVLEDYETFSVRGKNRIVIFPNVPFWIAVTETGFKALEEMSEYSCAITPQVRQAGNRLSGLTETAYASLLA